MIALTAASLIVLLGTAQAFMGVSVVKNGVRSRTSALATADICPEVSMQARPGREIAVVALGCFQ
jgi:hypothetical protein